MLLEIIDTKYIIFIASALIINIIVSIVQLKNRYKISEIIVCLILETIGIVIGAKLFDILTNIEIYKTMSIQEIILNGFSYWGAIFGAITGILIYSKFFKKSYIDLAQILFPNLILIYSISKIGCYLNGCCEGKILENGKQIPIQLIETVVFAIIYLYIIFKKFKNAYQKIFISSILFCVFKQILEIFRQPVNIMPISISQIISIWAIIILLIWYKMFNKEEKNDKSYSL